MHNRFNEVLEHLKSVPEQDYETKEFLEWFLNLF